MGDRDEEEKAPSDDGAAFMVPSDEPDRPTSNHQAPYNRLSAPTLLLPSCPDLASRRRLSSPIRLRKAEARAEDVEREKPTDHRPLQPPNESDELASSSDEEVQNPLQKNL